MDALTKLQKKNEAQDLEAKRLAGKDRLEFI
jgi:hypothetical protein